MHPFIISYKYNIIIGLRSLRKISTIFSVDTIQSTTQSAIDTTKQAAQTAVDYGKKAVDTTKGNIQYYVVANEVFINYDRLRSTMDC